MTAKGQSAFFQFWKEWNRVIDIALVNGDVGGQVVRATAATVPSGIMVLWTALLSSTVGFG